MIFISGLSVLALFASSFISRTEAYDPVRRRGVVYLIVTFDCILTTYTDLQH